MSAEDQITLDKTVRKVLHLHPGDRVSFDSVTYELLKTPTRKKWGKVIDRLPGEDVKVDKDCHYNIKKSPHFYKWMKDG